MPGNTWHIPGALPASEALIRARTKRFYNDDKWYDDGKVQIKAIWSPGHTPGSTNMLFRVKNPNDGKFHTFGYHGPASCDLIQSTGARGQGKYVGIR